MTPCSICSKPFPAQTTLHTICSPKCLLSRESVNRKAEKAERRETKRRLEAIKPRSHWMKEAQREFNKWIRARDAGLPCISCGRHHQGQHHAGHYLSTGARPELRFEPNNVHLQCAPCNVHLHGNLVNYRTGLVGRLGGAVVAALEGPHEPKHYSAEDLKAIRDKYRCLSKELQDEQK